MASTVRYGSCLCRQIRFTMTGEPFNHVLCHCTNCKKASGTAFMANIFFKENNVSITQGQDVIKCYEDPDNSSGRTIGRSFCSNCGSALFIHPSKEVPDNDFIGVTSGTFDGGYDWVPKKEFCAESKWNWLKDLAFGTKADQDENFGFVPVP